MVKRPMPCSVLQCSPWKQEVAKAKCRLAWSLEDRSKPKPNSQCSRPTQGETLVVCSMKNVQTTELCLSEPWKWSESEVLLFWYVENCSDGGALSLWTMTIVRERSSVVLRHISHSESETLLRFNLKSNLSVVVLTQDRYVEITYVICQRERYEKRRDLKNMLKRWPRFRRSQQRSYVHYLSATTESE